MRTLTCRSFQVSKAKKTRRHLLEKTIWLTILQIFPQVWLMVDDCPIFLYFSNNPPKIPPVS